MSGLIVPTHIAKRVQERSRKFGAKAPQQIVLDADEATPFKGLLNARMMSDAEFIADLRARVDTGKMRAPLWKVLTTPVLQRSVTKGGILLADETVAIQDWTHQLHKIVYVGKHVYKGPAYQGYDISPDEIPQVGQLWIVDPKQPRRWRYRNQLILLLNDDQLGCEVGEEDVEHLSFNGLDL